MLRLVEVEGALEERETLTMEEVEAQEAMEELGPKVYDLPVVEEAASCRSVVVVSVSRTTRETSLQNMERVVGCSSMLLVLDWLEAPAVNLGVLLVVAERWAVWARYQSAVVESLLMVQDLRGMVTRYRLLSSRRQTSVVLAYHLQIYLQVVVQMPLRCPLHQRHYSPLLSRLVVTAQGLQVVSVLLQV